MTEPGWVPDHTATLADAREWTREQAEAKGVVCPCCDQFAKVYRRPINAGMCRSLITMWRAARYDWQHVPTTVGGESREEGKLRYWGLTEEWTDGVRADGGRAGYWRITANGGLFVRRQFEVPRYAIIYAGSLIAVEGPMTSIVDALGTAFDYRELMGAEAAVVAGEPS